MLATRGRCEVGVPFQHLLLSGTGILHRRYTAPVAWNPRTQCRSFLRTEGEVSDRWPKKNWQVQINPSVSKSSSRFVHLGAASERSWVNIAPDVCGLYDNLNILHRALEFGKQGKNYKSPRSSWKESPSPLLQSKHKIFLSHSGKQKEFVKDLCEDLEALYRFPFFDIRPSSLPKGEPFPKYLFTAAQQCQMAVVVVSEEYFTSKWPMIELNIFVQARLESNPTLKILPLFFGLSQKEFKDPLRQERWFKEWKRWAKEDDRINPLDFQKAVKDLGLFNGFEFTQFMREVHSFRRMIVSCICKEISPDIKWDDSHVQGCLNICEVVCKKIRSVQASGNNKICILGFYGIGGIGKTTMCKILCNHLASEFDNKVCHVEMATNQSFEELLKEVLKKFTRTTEMLLLQLKEGECKHILWDEMSFQQKTFLAVDGVWDDSKSIEQAKMFLEAPFHEGSVVLVTARSQSTLAFLGIDESKCFEMPELGKADAKKLFLYYAAKGKQFVTYEDNQNIEKCLRCCYYQRSEKQGSHYLPLALKALGLQLSRLGNNPSYWMKSLSKIKDFNHISEEENPVFSIIRLNFDRLSVKEQALFMDIALYWPQRQFLDDDIFRNTYQDVMGLFEWLSLVHRQTLEDTETQLQHLKEKGLLEDVDINSQEVSMHDLYREFAEMESQGKLNSAGFNSRKWVYEHSYPNDLETTPSGRCWENLIRVGIKVPYRSRKSILSLDGIQWRYCSNVVVLNLIGLTRLKGVLNLKHLRCLRSLKIKDLDRLDRLEGLEDLNSLTYFQWLGGYVTFNDIVPWTHLGQLPAALEVLQVSGVGVHSDRDVFARCTNLRKVKLELTRAGDGLDFSQCTSLQSLELYEIQGLRNFSRFTTGLTSGLQSLCIHGCRDLSDLSGLDHLVGLKHLELSANLTLNKLPDLQKLTSLQVLRIELEWIAAVPGLCSLRQLRELRCSWLDITELPNLIGFEHLQRLDLSECKKLTTLKGVGHFPALRHLDLYGCESLLRLPDLSKCTNLEELDISWSGIELEEEDVYMLAKLPMLREMSSAGISLPLPDGVNHYDRYGVPVISHP